MFYLIKVVQGLGLAVVAAGFLASFPELMDMRLFAMGLVLFTAGWALERFLRR